MIINSQDMMRKSMVIEVKTFQNQAKTNFNNSKTLRSLKYPLTRQKQLKTHITNLL